MKEKKLPSFNTEQYERKKLPSFNIE